MQTRGTNSWIIVVLAIAVGFLAALLIFGGDDNKNAGATVGTTVANGTTTTTQGAPGTNGTSTTTTTGTTAPAATPTGPVPTTDGCINLWNQPTNRGDQVFLLNIATHGPIRVHVGATSDVPPKCLITVVTNSGDAYVFPAAGGTTYPYAQAPAKTSASPLPAAQKIANALDQSDGTLKAR